MFFYSVGCLVVVFDLLGVVFVVVGCFPLLVVAAATLLIYVCQLR